MYLLRLRPAVLVAASSLLGGPLAGCAALNPVAGTRAGDAGTWSPSGPRVAVVSSRPRRRPPPPPPPAATRIEPGPSVRVDAPVFLGEAAAAASAVESAIRLRADSWMGTRYRFGGEGRSGIDCSAFTRQIFREAFGMELPRNTALQVQEGSPVSRQDLVPGDLVFFRRGGTRHVGVYLGNEEFIHASTSQGVTISNLDEDYYRRYYWTARRVLGAAPEYASGEVRRRPERRAERAARRPASDSTSARTELSEPPTLTPVEEVLRRGW